MLLHRILLTALTISFFFSTPAMATTYEEIDIDRFYQDGSVSTIDIGLIYRPDGHYYRHADNISLDDDGNVIWKSGTKIQRYKDGYTETIWDNNIVDDIEDFMRHENGLALFVALETHSSGEVVQTLNFYDGEVIHKLDYLPDESLYFADGYRILLPGGYFRLYFELLQITSDGKAIWVSHRTRTRCTLKSFDGETINIIRENYSCRHMDEIGEGYYYGGNYIDRFGPIETNDQGQAVWTAGEIYFFDGSTTTRLTHSAGADKFPIINESGQLIAWRTTDEQNKPGLSIYTKNRIIELVGSADSISYVINDNNQIAWLVNDEHLFLYELDNISQVPTQGKIHNLQLNNGGWLSWNNENDDLSLYKEGKFNRYINNEHMGEFSRGLLKARVLNNGHAFVPTVRKFSNDGSSTIKKPGDIFYFNGESFENISGVEEAGESVSYHFERGFTETAKGAWVTSDEGDPEGCDDNWVPNDMWINIFDGAGVYRHRYNSLFEHPCGVDIRISNVNAQGDVLYTVREYGQPFVDLKLLKAIP